MHRKRSMVLPLLLAAAALSGCRADVEGAWRGSIGGSSLTLWLDQRGSAISGDACIDEQCTNIDSGFLEEERLELDLGCFDCLVPAMEMDLTLYDDTLEGDAHLLSCTPTGAGIDCNPPVHLTPCGADCGHQPAAVNVGGSTMGGGAP